MSIPFVPPIPHLPHHKYAIRDSATKRAMPFSETGAPTVTAFDGPTRAAQLLAVIDYLDVERSARYRRTPTSTWCNIFSTDVAYLSGVPLPHVYWVDDALARLVKGEDVPVRYGVTVNELSANGLYAWMLETGARYNWQRVGPELAQHIVNTGGFACCLAKKVSGSKIGHVSVVIPERGAEKALYDTGVDGKLLAPAQAQAGARNRRYFATSWVKPPAYVGGYFAVAWTDPATLLRRAVKDVIG